MNSKEIFQKRFAKLNTAQKEAVNQTDGPVMVIAGPGTGKTEILAARIAHILQKDTGAEPHNILCLTFTDSGTVAMRKRLLQFIGPTAYKVNIHTFHSFCNQVIQDNLDYFGKRELDLVSDLEMVEFLESLVESFPADHLLFHASGYYEAKRLLHLFTTMKSENWTVDDIEIAVKNYLSDLPHKPEFQYKRANSAKGIQVGDIKEKDIEKEKKKMNILLEAVKQFPQYQKFLKEKGRYDYHDMILWVLEKFQQHEELLAQYQEQFLYILVDEYQDTNGSQNELLNVLSNYWDVPNIFIVGDDDQSIFRFQGANLRNIMSFYHRYKNNVQVVVLEENYRSSQNILKTAQELIEENTERLIYEIPGLQKNLIAQNTAVAQSSLQPMVIEYYNELHEQIGIVTEIEKLYQQGIDLSEVAVIYKEHKQADTIIKLLEAKNIPLQVKASVNILEDSFIQNIIRLLKYISQEIEEPYSGEHDLFHILHFPFWNIPAKDIATLLVKIRIWKKQNKSQKQQETEELSLFGLIDNDTVDTLRDLIANEIKLSSIPGLASQETIIRVGKLLDQWLKNTQSMTVLEQIEVIIQQSGILEYILESDDKIWLMRLFSTFFNFIKEESRRNPGMSLVSLLKTLEQMQLHNIRLSVQKMTFAENGIHFLTAHASKGLEFEYVFIIGCQSHMWDKKKKGFDNYNFPDTLTFSNEGNEIQEARRLMYVAITRAKEKLFLSYSAENLDGKEMEKSQFIAEVLENMNVEFEERHVDDEIILEYQTLLLAQPEEKNQELIDSEYMDIVLENYRLNVSHLNKYLRCPVSFYYENILRVPAAMNEYMAFGSAIHYALEHYFRNAKSHGVYGDEKLLFMYFDLGMKIYQDLFTSTQFERRINYGKEVLQGYYDQYKDGWNTSVIVEYNINNVEYNGIPLSGKLDKIEFDHNDVNVVDYKTGKYYRGRQRLNRPNERDPLGGDYWRQMVFYKLLIDAESKQHWNMLSAEMDFVEKDKDSGEYKKEKLYISKEDIEFVTQQVEETYKKIMNKEFLQGCGEQDCYWCNMNI